MEGKDEGLLRELPRRETVLVAGRVNLSLQHLPPLRVLLARPLASTTPTDMPHTPVVIRALLSRPLLRQQQPVHA